MKYLFTLQFPAMIFSIFLSSALLSTSINAFEYNVKNGWQLLGVVDDIDDLEIFNDTCVQALWKYESTGWRLHVTSDINTSVNASYETMSSLNQTEGFWLYANDNCSVLSDVNQTDTNGTNEINATTAYSIVDTNQNRCYDSISGLESSCIQIGYDADYNGNQPSYTLNGSIVMDNITDIMWTQSSDLDADGITTDIGDKLSQEDAISYCSNLTLDGYSNWRLPDIKTLYSLILFSGQDPSSYTSTDTSSLQTFLDSSFSRAFGDYDAGERIIDGQYATTTNYVHTTMNGDATMFGVNFVDGRIKGYPLSSPMTGELNKYYVLCSRGNETYGVNDFFDNNDSTISDRATNLMWQKNDSLSTDFEDSVSICENATTGAYNNWRLPNAKELQSIVDYSRSPDTTNSASINKIFNATSFLNEEGIGEIRNSKVYFKGTYWEIDSEEETTFEEGTKVQVIKTYKNFAVIKKK